jgi:hypothetical protein
VLLFLSGAEMQPERVRAVWPDAQFLARAHTMQRPVGAVPPPAGVHYETWGILIDAPSANENGESRTVVTDDGRTMRAVLASPDTDDPGAVLAAAKYWELPYPYVQRLARIAAAPVEEYFY